MNDRRKRTPKGVACSKPIALRLMPDERAEAEIISKRIGLTKSALSREAYLAGLPLVLKNHPSAETSPVESIASSTSIGAASTFSSPALNRA